MEVRFDLTLVRRIHVAVPTEKREEAPTTGAGASPRGPGTTSQSPPPSGTVNAPEASPASLQPALG